MGEGTRRMGVVGLRTLAAGMAEALGEAGSLGSGVRMRIEAEIEEEVEVGMDAAAAAAAVVVVVRRVVLVR